VRETPSLSVDKPAPWRRESMGDVGPNFSGGAPRHSSNGFRTLRRPKAGVLNRAGHFTPALNPWNPTALARRLREALLTPIPPGASTLLPAVSRRDGLTPALQKARAQKGGRAAALAQKPTDHDPRGSRRLFRMAWTRPGYAVQFDRPG